MNINDKRISELKHEIQNLSNQLQQVQQQIATHQQIAHTIFQNLLKKQGALDELQAQSKRGK